MSFGSKVGFCNRGQIDASFHFVGKIPDIGTRFSKISCSATVPDANCKTEGGQGSHKDPDLMVPRRPRVLSSEKGVKWFSDDWLDWLPWEGKKTNCQIWKWPFRNYREFILNPWHLGLEIFRQPITELLQGSNRLRIILVGKGSDRLKQFFSRILGQAYFFSEILRFLHHNQLFTFRYIALFSSLQRQFSIFLPEPYFLVSFQLWGVPWSSWNFPKTFNSFCGAILMVSESRQLLKLSVATSNIAIKVKFLYPTKSWPCIVVGKHLLLIGLLLPHYGTWLRKCCHRFQRRPWPCSPKQ